MKKVLAYLFLCATLLVSCQKEVDISLIEKPASPGTEFVEVSMNLSTEPLSGDSSDGTTKSQMSPSADDAFTGAVLFAFNHSTGNILLDGGSNPCVKVTAEKSFSWSLPRDIAMDIYAIANYDGNIEGIGSLLSNPSLTTSDLTSLTFTCTAVSGLSSIPMSGINENVTLNNVNTTISVTVKRLMAKYMFYFNLDEILAAGYTVEATSISACKSNTVVPVFYTGAGIGYAQTNEALLATIDTGTSADLTNLSAGGSSNAVTLYFLENCQGRKDGCSTWSQVDGSGLSGLNLCSYLDVRVSMTKAAVVRNETYKIYLGSNSASGGTACVSNFDVVRNVAKGIRMNLHTPEDLITWRMKSVTISPSSIGVGGNATATAIKEKYVNGVASGIESPATVSVWVSSNPSVATVSSGTVTGVAEGTYTITATDTSCEEGYQSVTSSTSTVSNVVTYRISSIVYNKTTLDYGETATPTVYRQCYVNGVASGDPEVVPNSYFDWSSGTTTVATVNSSGVVTASSTNTGSSVITATLKAEYQGVYEAGYYSGTATITVAHDAVVNYRITSVVLGSASLYNSGTTTATVYRQRYVDGVATGAPEVIANSYFDWSSNSTGVATVNASGVVTANASNTGSATITATVKAAYNSEYQTSYRSGSATVSVSAAPSASLTLSPWDFSGDYDDYVGYSNSASQTASYSNTGPEGYFTSYSSNENNCSSSDYEYGNSGATVWVYWNSANSSSSPRSVDIYLRDPDTGVEDYIRCTQGAYSSSVVFDHWEYGNVSVSISAGTTSFTVSGGSTTLSASASYQRRAVYSDNSRGSWEGSYSGTPTISTISEDDTFNRSGTSVTVSSNSSTSSKSARYSASYTLTGYTYIDSSTNYDYDYVDLDQDGVSGPVFSHWEYGNCDVTISAGKTSFTEAGGSTTLSASASYQRRAVYSDNSRGSWEGSYSGTPTISTISEDDTFNRSGTSVTVSANGSSSSKSATYQASYTIDETYVDSSTASDSYSVVLSQDGHAATVTIRLGISPDLELNVGESGSITLYREVWEDETCVSSSVFGNWSGSSNSNSSVASLSGSAGSYSVTGVSEGVATMSFYVVSSEFSAGYKSASCTVTVNDVPGPVDEFLYYEYGNCSVSISAGTTYFPAAGGSTTLTATATYQRRAVYSLSGAGAWTGSYSGTPTITTNYEYSTFHRSGTSVYVDENLSSGGAAASYTASYTITGYDHIDSSTNYDDDAVELTQEAYFMPYCNVNPDGHVIAWNDTSTFTSEIDTNVSGTITVSKSGSIYLTTSLSGTTVSMRWITNNTSTTTDREATVNVYIGGVLWGEISCIQEHKEANP